MEDKWNFNINVSIIRSSTFLVNTYRAKKIHPLHNDHIDHLWYHAHKNKQKTILENNYDDEMVQINYELDTSEQQQINGVW